MVKYTIEFVASAAKEYRALPADVKRRVMAAVDNHRVFANFKEQKTITESV